MNCDITLLGWVVAVVVIIVIWEVFRRRALPRVLDFYWSKRGKKKR